jgi:hypothetical protein
LIDAEGPRCNKNCSQGSRNTTKNQNQNQNQNKTLTLVARGEGQAGRPSSWAILE